MLTAKDIQKLIGVFATKDEVATKKDLGEVRKNFASLATGVDKYAQKSDTYFQEMVMLSH